MRTGSWKISRPETLTLRLTATRVRSSTHACPGVCGSVAAGAPKSPADESATVALPPEADVLSVIRIVVGLARVTAPERRDKLPCGRRALRAELVRSSCRYLSHKGIADGSRNPVVDSARWAPRPAA